MNIDSTQLYQHIIEPTLSYLGCNSLGILDTLRRQLHQQQVIDLLGDQQGLGLFQISRRQHREVWEHFLAFEPDLASLIRGLASQHHFLLDPEAELISNFRYNTAIAWALIAYQQQANTQQLANA